MDVEWWDAAAGPLVRPYTITRGRTPPASTQLDIATMVMTISLGSAPDELEPEHVTIAEMCQRPFSIAEIGNKIGLPLGVVRVLCGDLIERGLVIIRSPSAPVNTPDHALLQAVLDGLQKL
jgi:hypothetical protein